MAMLWYIEGDWTNLGPFTERFIYFNFSVQGGGGGTTHLFLVIMAGWKCFEIESSDTGVEVDAHYHPRNYFSKKKQKKPEYFELFWLKRLHYATHSNANANSIMYSVALRESMEKRANSCRESNPGPLAWAASASTTELRMTSRLS